MTPRGPMWCVDLCTTTPVISPLIPRRWLVQAPVDCAGIQGSTSVVK
jgi:hypothetical protein